MDITKRTAKALNKHNLAEIGRLFGVTKQAVQGWIKFQRIPNDKVDDVQEFTGLKIK